MKKSEQNWSLYTRLNSLSEVQVKRREVLDQMDHDTVYVIDYITEKTRQSITGRYVNRDLTEVVLLTEKGKFRRIPVERITKINFYHEAPF